MSTNFALSATRRSIMENHFVSNAVGRPKRKGANHEIDLLPTQEILYLPEL